ncbi:hypothetical protein GGS23DRAFT_545895 [Durotheca rogersii]|uniref:uncharacterized protein n=1 Tax=Durotheca rogersii TaxID=419775 RepID=UPI002220E5A2|nr:uncharacterized protein GGS23DRAFT_545895 [Durotheca rogersii]KAI5868503.1 hypothetical protein GGS23DRAFT_545895 [Durotheca rogersii]
MVSPVGIFFIVLAVLLVVAAVGWIVFTQLRARRLGLPAPPLSSYIPFVRSDPSPYGAPQSSSRGVGGWLSDKFRSLRGGNNRSGPGAYERPSHRGFGPLDPDDAWDTRVGHHETDGYYGAGAGGPSGYYEEQELGYREPGGGQQQSRYNTTDNGTGYAGANLAAAEEQTRGRSRSRDPPGGSNRNPFDDEAELSSTSLRGVSPRPIDTGVSAGPTTSTAKGGGAPGSPTSERRSIFREDV